MNLVQPKQSHRLFAVRLHQGINVVCERQYCVITCMCTAAIPVRINMVRFSWRSFLVLVVRMMMARCLTHMIVIHPDSEVFASVQMANK